eukprot:TRINITY_DN18818_c0_g1_i1.p1 TRINITY_DN18818_c0_g1~~TRINITY_DN18818_c0_g1_i1.p1  ORF type:complete len:430 (+),score=96.07 TRINITY_DN18818_c0_g1_i1:131-1291(+)
MCIRDRSTGTAFHTMALKTTVAGITLQCCIYNASGPKSGHISDLRNTAASRAGAVLAKSATLIKQTGNPLPRLKEIPTGDDMCAGSINSEGLPNAGIEYYLSDTVLSGVAESGKPYIVSLSGLKLADNLEMLNQVAAASESGNIAGVELNLACPNIPGKPTVALDFEQMEEVIQAVVQNSAFKNSGLPLGIKLAPYFDGPHFDAAAAIINAHKDRIGYVVTMNTIGNCLVLDVETESAVIAPKGGFGGVAGGFAKPIALAQVAQLRKRLDPSIDIVGVGGVTSGSDAFELILCGAAAVQVATTHWLEGPGCFDRIASELEALMAAKGYSTIEDFKGKLKPYDPKNRPAAPKSKTKAAPIAWAQWLLVLILPILAVLMQRELARQTL